MEKHSEGWIYSGQASDRLWSKSAIGRPLDGSGLLLSGAEVIFCHEHRHIEFPHPEWMEQAVMENSGVIDEAAIIEALRVPGNKIVLKNNLEHLGIDASSDSWAARWSSDKHPRQEGPLSEIRWFHSSDELKIEDLHVWASEVSSKSRVAEVIVVDDETSVVTYRVNIASPRGDMGELDEAKIVNIRNRQFKPLANGGVIVLDVKQWPEERVGIPHPNGRMLDSITSDLIYSDRKEDFTMGASILADLLSRGLHCRPGFKYGTRWRCYDKPLGQEHAPWLVVHPTEAPSDWEGACLASRLASGVGKTWLHPLQNNGAWEYLSISRPPADSRWSNPNRR